MSYIDGFVLAVPRNKKEEYRKVAAESAAIFKEHGAIRVVECWGNDVPDVNGDAVDIVARLKKESKVRLRETDLMADDGMGPATPEFKGMTLVLSAARDADSRRVFDALANGGTVQMPLAKTFWTSSFGMLTNKFGVPYMVMTESAS